MKKKINIHELLHEPTKVYEKFHDATKIKKKMKQLPYESLQKELKTITYKGYSRMEEILLPKPSLPVKTSLVKTLLDRKSERSFSGKKLNAQELSNLLYFSAGEYGKEGKVKRFYPSAGARYPIEVYVFIRDGEIPPGTYHYYIKNNSLEKIRECDSMAVSEFMDQEWLNNAPCLIIMTAIFNRNTAKYGDRGYRHVMIEAGCLMQNIYLISSALRISCCSTGGYVDDKINKLLDVDGLRESVVGILAIGK